VGDRAELTELRRVLGVLLKDAGASRYTWRVIATGDGAGVRARGSAWARMNA
jgi:hypothetical protein